METNHFTSASPSKPDVTMPFRVVWPLHSNPLIHIPKTRFRLCFIRLERGKIPLISLWSYYLFFFFTKMTKRTSFEREKLARDGHDTWGLSSPEPGSSCPQIRWNNTGRRVIQSARGDLLFIHMHTHRSASLGGVLTLLQRAASDLFSKYIPISGIEYLLPSLLSGANQR